MPAIVVDPELQSLCRDALDDVCNRGRFDLGFVLVVADDEAHIVATAGDCAGAHDCTMRLARGTGIIWQAIDSMQPVRSRSYAHDAHAVPSLRATGVQQVLCHPILCDGSVVAVLVGCTMGTRRQVTRAQLQCLERSTAQLTVAFRYSYFRARRAREFELLTAIAADISDDVDPHQLLQRIVNAVTQLLDAESVFLWQDEPATDTFRVVAASDPANALIGLSVPRSAGAVGEAARRRAAVVIDDYQSWPGRIFPSDENPPAALMAVPLLAGNDILGMLSVASLRLARFDAEACELVQHFAQHATIAIKNARLYKDATRRADIAERLRSATRAAASSLDMRQTIEHILDQIALVIAYESASVQIVDPNHPELMVIGGRGFPPESEFLSRRFLLTSENAGAQVVADRRPLIVQTGDTRWVFHYELIERFSSWLGVPLIARDQVIGLITLDRYTGAPFNDDDAQLAMAFADHVAVALDHAQIHNQLTETARLDKELYDASLALGAVLDLEQLYERIYHTTRRLLALDAFVLALADEARHEIEYVYLMDEDVRHPVVRRPLNTGIAGYVIRTGESLFLDRMDEEIARRYNTYSFGQPTPERLQIIAVPLRVRDKVIGMISAQTCDEQYTAAQQRALEQLAANTAIALENARLFDEVQRLATIDPLTNIYNRYSFFRIAEAEIDRAYRYRHELSILLLDADRFKQINDTFGHRAGDVALCAIIDRCRSGLRASDVFGRYGGEEMVVLLPETDLATATVVAERLCELVDQDVVTDAGTFRVTCSIGIASYLVGERLEHVLERVDRALYRAKHAGRNRVAVAE